MRPLSVLCLSVFIMLILRSCFALPAALLLFATGPAFAAHPTPPRSHRVRVARPPAATSPTSVTPLRAGAPLARSGALATDTAAEPAATARRVLSGTVLSTDGRPCVGACIFATTNTHQIAVTDRQGAFWLAVPTGPPVQLQADYFGLGSSRVMVKNQPAQPVRIVIGQ